MFTSLGYSGVGLPRGTISGSLLAEFALDAESDLNRALADNPEQWQAMSAAPRRPIWPAGRRRI